MRKWTDDETTSEKILRKFGYIKLERIRVRDLAEVGQRLNIRFDFRLKPRWVGPWFLEDNEWHRVLQTIDGHKHVKGPKTNAQETRADRTVNVDG